ncbi:MAG TPA: DNA-directed RNA polymerase subunit alpha C-terminal domain-containing protein [Pirellulales bacterium]|nr:DNA-directed RNA polymerase subunit alpha C-terminal domain-containing protein [Pirellulales bacterium]
MPQAVEVVDIKPVLLSDAPLDAAGVRGIIDTLASDATHYRAVRESVQELEAKAADTPAMKLKLGIAYYLMGRFRLATQTLGATQGGVAKYYLGKSAFALEDHRGAIEAYEAAAKGGYDSDASALARAEAMRYLGDAPAALKILDGLSGAIEQTAEYLYQRGATVAAIGGNPNEVVALLERAVENDPKHAGALFALAVENDRRGNDDAALDLYQRSTSRFPAHLGALLNLAILYEDRQQYEKARQCYQRILDAYPSHPRARLFFKDAQASGEMYFDEDAQRRRDRLSQVLNLPVTDFELSVRSRNCLQKMGLLTLGDLARTTEQELLSSKNFGETSLVEIKEMMASKGLQLGQFAGEKRVPEVSFEPEMMTPDEQALLNKPIADLNLSVRARKCMIRLGISTIGELLRRTGDELLECKNFGVTSLNEVRDKLTTHGLKLRGD